MIDPISSSKTPAVPTSAAGGAQDPSRPDEERDTQKVAEDFTAVLMQMVVREMFETVKSGGDDESSGPFGGSDSGGDVYRGMAETAFGQALAKDGVESLTSEVKRAIDRVARAVPSEAAGASGANATEPPR